MRRTALIFACVFMSVPVMGDTFTNRETGEVFHGYATQTKRGDKTLVRVGKSHKARYIEPGDYRVEWDLVGRRNQVIVIPIQEEIELECETSAFEKAIKASSNQGPAFILIEIDTPGGRMDLMKRVCSAITSTDNCVTVGFVRGGKYGGAYSAGAIIALACNYVYMAEDTAIGAATPILQSGLAFEDLKSAFGRTVGEKFLSASRGYVASIAEGNGRSGLLAKAMVDEDIRVVEVSDGGERFFIEPGEQRRGESVVRTWSEKGSLLTLTVSEAVECGIADGLAESRKSIASRFRLEEPRIVQSTEPVKARRKFEAAKEKMEKLIISIDRHVKEVEVSEDKAESLRLLDKLVKKYKELIALKKANADLPVTMEACKKAVNSAEAARRNIKKL
jgi:hypothetical protein